VLHEKNRTVFRMFRRKVRILLEKIPPEDYQRIMDEAQELVDRIVADKELYEPIHCAHGHEVELRRMGMTPQDVAKSRDQVKVIAMNIAAKSGKVLIAAMSSYMVWYVAEFHFWWF